MKNLVVDENEKMRVGITILKVPDPPLETSSEEKKTEPEESTGASSSSGLGLEGKADVMSALEALDEEENQKTDDRKKVYTLSKFTPVVPSYPFPSHSD
jgi:hypothetical protein